MPLDPVDWSKAFRSDEVHAALPAELRSALRVSLHAYSDSSEIDRLALALQRKL